MKIKHETKMPKCIFIVLSVETDCLLIVRVIFN